MLELTGKLVKDGRYYRLEDIMMAIAENNTQDFALKALIKEISSLGEALNADRKSYHYLEAL